MKKNIWENVYYRLNDETEIKLAVLFCIKYADIPISDIELKHFMLEATSVDFIDLCSAISAVQQEGYIRVVSREETDKYDLTLRGGDTLEMFEDKIMASVRSSLRCAIDEYFHREQNKTQVRCEIEPVKKDAYCVNIELKEGKDTFVTMSLFAGSKEKAYSLRRGFLSDPAGMYARFVTLLSEEDPKKDEEDV